MTLTEKKSNVNDSIAICEQKTNEGSRRNVFSRRVIVDLVALLDGFIITGCGILIKYIYVDYFLHIDQSRTAYVGMSITCAILCIFVMNRRGHYDPEQIRQQSAPIACIFRALSMSFLLLLAVAFLLRITDQYARGWIIIWFLSSFVAVSVARTLIRAGIERLARKGLFNKRVAIIGCDPVFSRVREYIERHSADGDLVGIFRAANMSAEDPGAESALTVKLRELAAFGRTNPLDQVIVALPSYDEARIQEILLELSPLATHIDFLPCVVALSTKRPGMRYIGNLGLYNLQRRPINEWGVVAKRALDLTLVVPALIVLAIPMLVIAAIIRLTSPGRALFIQERHGLNNNVIRVLKYRTMADRKRPGDHQVKKDDMEVTKAGRFLRRFSLDELPQLINVLRGDMSLVGPRPHPVKMNEKFADVVQRNKALERVERYAARHKVKPGITGWAQVNKLRGETDTREKIEKRVAYDLQYISEWSIWLDVKIILMTFRAVLNGENAH